MKKRLFSILALSALLVSLCIAAAFAANGYLKLVSLGDFNNTKLFPGKEAEATLKLDYKTSQPTGYVGGTNTTSIVIQVESNNSNVETSVKELTYSAAESAKYGNIAGYRDDLGGSEAEKEYTIKAKHKSSSTITKEESATITVNVYVVNPGSATNNKTSDSPVSKTITIALTPQKAAPIFTTTADDATETFSELKYKTEFKAEDAPYVIDASSSYPDVKTWAVTGLPAGLQGAGSGNTFKIWGTPLEVANEKSVTVTATNAQGKKDLKFTVTVDSDKDFDWDLEKDDDDGYDPEVQTRFDMHWGVGSKLADYNKIGVKITDGKMVAEAGTDASLYAGTQKTKTANPNVVSAEPGFVEWKITNLPDGMTETHDGTHLSFDLTKKFTKATPMKWASDVEENGYYIVGDGFITRKVVPAKPLTITATNKAMNATKSRTIYMSVWDTPKFKTAKKLTDLTTEKAYKQKIEFTNEILKLAVFVKEKEADGTVPANWHSLTSGDALKEFEPTDADPLGGLVGYSFKTYEESGDKGAALKTTANGTAGRLYWNVKDGQLEGTLTKVPAGNAIDVRVYAWNPALGTNPVLTQDFTIAVKGIKPAIALADDFTLDLVSEDNKAAIVFKPTKGTYPMTLQATIDKTTAKAFGLGNSELVIANDLATGTDADIANLKKLTCYHAGRSCYWYRTCKTRL